MRILIVDDAAFMRLLIRNILEKQGYEIAEAASGEEALAAYEQAPFSLVTLDLTMPGLGGLETLKELLRRDPQARVLMVSSTGQQRTIGEVIQAGALDFIVKPFQQERLIYAVARARTQPVG